MKQLLFILSICLTATAANAQTNRTTDRPQTDTNANSSYNRMRETNPATGTFGVPDNNRLNNRLDRPNNLNNTNNPTNNNINNTYDPGNNLNNNNLNQQNNNRNTPLTPGTNMNNSNGSMNNNMNYGSPVIR